MGFIDAILGRSRPARPDLDALFAVPSAAVTLQTSMGLVPTGDGAVCYRSAAGAAFADAERDVVELLRSVDRAPEVRVSQDGFGFTWLEVDHPPFDPAADDLAGLCTDLHAVNTALEGAGFGPALLCTLVPFRDASGDPSSPGSPGSPSSPGSPGSPGSGRRAGLVYLFKQGTFYPFAPVGGAGGAAGAGRQRDTLLEMQLRDQLAGELPMERDPGRWFPVWGAPGL